MAVHCLLQMSLRNVRWQLKCLACHGALRAGIVHVAVDSSRRTEQRRTGGGLGFQPPPEIPKALQNRAKFNPIVKTVKNC